MSNRTAKFVSAIFASLLASAALATVSHSAAAECLSGPKDKTPDGSHWHFRIEHPSERHCWYLRGEGETLSQTASANSPTPAKPAPLKTEPAIQRSIANAHAEVLQSATAVQPVPATSSGTENTPRANADGANMQASTIASRWPGQPDTNSPVSPPPLATGPDASASSNSKAAAPRPIATVALATADSSSKKQFGSIQMWLTVAMGALSLAAVMGSAFFRSDDARWIGERDENRGRRRVNWDSHDAGDLALSAYPNVPGDPRADDPDRRIAEMLARLSRSAAA